MSKTRRSHHKMITRYEIMNKLLDKNYHFNDGKFQSRWRQLKKAEDERVNKND